MAKREYVKSRTIQFVLNGVMHHMEVQQIVTNSLDIDKRIQCPICQKYVALVSETFERGKYQDKCSLLVACRACNTAFLYNYTLATYDVITGEAPEADASAAV